MNEIKKNGLIYDEKNELIEKDKIITELKNEKINKLSRKLTSSSRNIYKLSNEDLSKGLNFTIDENIAKPAQRKTEMALKAATEMNADWLLLRLNTFGGELDAADKIRTAFCGFGEL